MKLGITFSTLAAALFLASSAFAQSAPPFGFVGTVGYKGKSYKQAFSLSRAYGGVANFTSEYLSPMLRVRFGLCNKPYTFATASSTKCYFFGQQNIYELFPGESQNFQFSKGKMKVKSGKYTPTIFLEEGSGKGVYDYGNFKRITIK